MSTKDNYGSHYGGADNPYEAIKVIKAWGYLNDFCIGNVLKYLCRQGKKAGQSPKKDLEKALWYLEQKIGEIDELPVEEKEVKKIEIEDIIKMRVLFLINMMAIDSRFISEDILNDICTKVYERYCPNFWKSTTDEELQSFITPLIVF